MTADRPDSREFHSPICRRYGMPKHEIANLSKHRILSRGYCVEGPQLKSCIGETHGRVWTVHQLLRVIQNPCTSHRCAIHANSLAIGDCCNVAVASSRSDARMTHTSQPHTQCMPTFCTQTPTHAEYSPLNHATQMVATHPCMTAARC